MCRSMAGGGGCGGGCGGSGCGGSCGAGGGGGGDGVMAFAPETFDFSAHETLQGMVPK